MTGRGWWTLFTTMLTLAVGILMVWPVLTLIGLTLLLWLGWEWLFFSLRLRTLLPQLRVEREVCDDRGPVSTLWAGHHFTVRAGLHLGGIGKLSFIAIADPVPFGVVYQDGETATDGELRRNEPLEVEYRINCPLAGVARFEGMRVEVTDLHGFFAHVAFVRAPVEFRILPRVLVPKAGGAMTKRNNQLPPPGIHRLRQPGSGSELLDLRDYIPGDPPRTIAWKVSARKDKLVTREYENEVPIRTTLFLDASSSVRIPSPVGDIRSPDSKTIPLNYRPLDQLVEVAAGAIRASAGLRDLTGLCVFDENAARVTPPKRTARHITELMQQLGEVAALGPSAARADPEPLTLTAFALAREVYPDLLRQEVNRTPTWLTWLVAYSRFSRHWRGYLDALHRRKREFLLWGTTGIPLFVLLVNVLSLFVEGLPDWSRGLLAALLLYGVPLLATVAWLAFLLSLLVSGNARRQARMRKQLSAIFAARYGLASGGLALLLEDDDLYSLYLQRFLAEHQVPFVPTLYDAQGRYLLAAEGKVRVLADALLAASGRAKDNELFVILADLLDLDGKLEPLLQAVRVALGRHHQVLVICTWPRGVPPPRQEQTRRKPRGETPAGTLATLAQDRLHAAYLGIRRSFARLGVQVTTAGSEESVPLILDRVQRLRAVGGRR